jgi:hypothetical protein
MMDEIKVFNSQTADLSKYDLILDFFQASVLCGIVLLRLRIQ